MPIGDVTATQPAGCDQITTTSMLHKSVHVDYSRVTSIGGEAMHLLLVEVALELLRMKIILPADSLLVKNVVAIILVQLKCCVRCEHMPAITKNIQRVE